MTVAVTLRAAVRSILLLASAVAAAPLAAAGEAAAPPRDEAALVAGWNELAFEVGRAEDDLRTFKTQRAMAIVHLAMHDAVNAVVARYAPYALSARDPAADPVAAAAHAAHAVLVELYPAARPRADALLGQALAGATEGAAVERGAVLGARAAEVLLAARRGDGWDRPGAYQFRSGPGAYQTTPPWDSFVLQPGFRHALPFALTAPDQFRPAPPPALDSPEAARALAEVRRQGAREGSARTADQSAYAVWWMEFAEGSVSRLARELAVRRELDLADAARLFALLSVSLYDAYVATWDAKYEYDHWRPSTAIAAAAPGDAGSAWEPVLPPPPFPEYVSAHAAGCAAAFEVLDRVLGDAGPFTMRTTTAPPGMLERRFPDFASAAAECADSRVRLGWHFRYATDAGLALGRAVAGWAIERHLVPR